MKTARILLADNQAVVRCGVRTLLKGRENYDVCGETGTREGILHKVALLRPDLVILGNLPQQDKGSLIREIREGLPTVEILVLSTEDSEDSARRAVSAGARGYVLTSDSNREFLRAIENIVRGRPYVSQKASECILNALRTSSAPRKGWMRNNLTSREREIAQHLVEAESNKQIASVLKISVRTVEAHRAKIMSKLGLHSVIELVRYAMANGGVGERSGRALVHHPD